MPDTRERKLAPQQLKLFKAMTPLQQQIVTGLLAGLQPLDAYAASSGKAKKAETQSATVSEILTRPNVTAFMDSVREDEIQDVIMTRNEGLERLTRMARFNVGKLGKVSEGGFMLKDDLTDDDLECVNEITGTGRDTRLKIHDQKDAIDKIAKLQGWQAAYKHDNSEEDDNAPLVLDVDDAELGRLLLHLFTKGAKQAEKLSK